MIVKYPFDINEKVTRGGVIPYTIKDGIIYFLLGIDYKTNEFTDFGGGVKINEKSIDAAFREFREETHSIFPNNIYDRESFTNFTAINDKSMLIVFLPIMSHWFKKAKTKFYYKRKKTKFNEIYSVKWIDEYSFKNLILCKHECMYNKVSNFLYDICGRDEFYDTLREKF